MFFDESKRDVVYLGFSTERKEFGEENLLSPEQGIVILCLSMLL